MSWCSMLGIYCPGCMSRYTKSACTHGNTHTAHHHTTPPHHTLHKAPCLTHAAYPDMHHIKHIHNTRFITFEKILIPRGQLSPYHCGQCVHQIQRSTCQGSAQGSGGDVPWGAASNTRPLF